MVLSDMEGGSLQRDRAVTCTCRSGDGAADVQFERYGRGGAAVLLASVPLERVWCYTYKHKPCALGRIYVFIYVYHALVADNLLTDLNVSMHVHSYTFA